MVSSRTARALSPSPRGGFTLIELLVVIAIISLLVSILMPTLRKAKEHAIVASCQVTMRSSLLLAQIYAADFSSFPDVRAHPNWNNATITSHSRLLSGMTAYWAEQVDPKGFETNNSLMCPSPDLKPSINKLPLRWRQGSWIENADPTWSWDVRKQPYYKAVMPGTNIPNENDEPFGMLSLWYKGLSDLFYSRTALSFTPNGEQPRHDIIPPLPQLTIPMLTCPTWLGEGLSGWWEESSAYTPHGGFQLVGYGTLYYKFNEGLPLERNIGFSDGHVTYYRKQSKER
ncbi:MAG: prepilin-type N-terminal cleavage/methylation domain-containing protein [Phycisphaerae bacterium]|nr:prepilin-type N-terminal cleavage/methylation domain-containing protein [Phycisphaerae bacterium]